MDQTPFDTGTPHLQARRIGRLGQLRLNRPAALNALTWPMLHDLHRALRAWEHDPRVETILLEGAGERAFCAGGDIAVVRRSALAGGTEARRLWRHEYALDLRLARYQKPVVSILDGLVLGGGVGISAHRRYRVVTEHTALAMPEVAIGLAPDVGGLLLLARLPGELGTHLALTGQRLGPAQLLANGLAEVFMARANLPHLKTLLQTGDVPSSLAEVAEQLEPAAPAPAWIARCYLGSDAEQIVARLRAESDPEAKSAADTIEAACPTAVKVTLAAIRRAARMDELADCLRQDYQLSVGFLRRPDLIEGIRAAVIDKDRHPRWSPARLADVSEADVSAFFAEPVA